MSVDLSQRVALPRAEAAAAVGISERTLREAIKRGDLVERYIGSKPVVEVDELRAWVSSLPTEGPRR